MIDRRIACLAFAFAFVAGCEAETGGSRAFFELAIVPIEGAWTTHTSTGWDVTLTEACISVGPVYFYAGDAAGTARRLYDALIPSAHAHPGVDHFAGGEVRGEWLDTIAVDLLAPTAVGLGRIEGIVGSVRSTTVNLTPPGVATRGAVGCLRGHQAWVAGVARRGTMALAFEGGLDIEGAGNRQRIQIASDVSIDDGVEVVIRVDPRPWLDAIEFDQLAPAPGGKAPITAESQARAAWFLGVQRAEAFSVGSFAMAKQ